METQEVTYRVKLNAKETDGFGYTTLVFERFEYNDYDDQFVMCVMFPNWSQSSIDIGDTGYVKIKYVREGEDKWYDGSNFIPYKNTDIIFLKFVREKAKIVESEIIVD